MVKYMETPSGGIQLYVSKEDIGSYLKKKSKVKIIRLWGHNEYVISAVVEFPSGFQKVEYIGDYKPI